MFDEEPSKQAKSNSLEQAFRDAEASLLLEGLDPTKDSRYLTLKAQVIAGTLTFEEAKSAFKAQFRESMPTRAALAVSA